MSFKSCLLPSVEVAATKTAAKEAGSTKGCIRRCSDTGDKLVANLASSFPWCRTSILIAACFRSYSFSQFLYCRNNSSNDSGMHTSSLAGRSFFGGAHGRRRVPDEQECPAPHRKRRPAHTRGIDGNRLCVSELYRKVNNLSKSKC